MSAPTQTHGRRASDDPDEQNVPHQTALARFGRVGLAGRTGFYLILTALTIRIAVMGGSDGRQADAHGALAIVDKSLIGKVAIGAVAAGFFIFGADRIIGAVTDHTVSRVRRLMTFVQGVFYLFLAYVPADFLAGNGQTGSQQQQQKTSGEVLNLPGGTVILVFVGLILIGVCAQQIRGAWAQTFQDGLDLDRAPRWVKKIAGTAGTVGITSRALVFLPIGVFLIVAAFQHDPSHSYGTDAELLKISGYTWGLAVLALVAGGLSVFVVFSTIETLYRKVVSAR